MELEFPIFLVENRIGIAKMELDLEVATLSKIGIGIDNTI